MSIERLQRYKLAKSVQDVDRTLRFVVRSASENIAAYSRLLNAAGISVEHFQGSEDLPRLPIVAREKLMLDTPISHRISRRADPPRLVSRLTSGSDGMPVQVFMSRTEALFRKLVLFRAWRHVVPFRLPCTVIDVGVTPDLPDTLAVSWHGPIRLVRVPLSRIGGLNPDLLQRYRPVVLGGYPSSLLLLAERLARLHACPPLPSLQMVASRGEILHESARRSLEESFRCLVADFYNCEEVGNIAWQCPAESNRLHINTDACVVEVVDESDVPVAAGVNGRILVTSLYNCTMPLIRYELQDLGHIFPATGTPCKCGSKLPAMGLIQGREDDILILSDGTRASPRWLATALEQSVAQVREDALENVPFRRYEIVQDAPKHVTIRIVPATEEEDRVQQSILRAFREIDAGMDCTVELVSGLPSAASGKARKVRRETFSS